MYLFTRVKLSRNQSIPMFEFSKLAKPHPLKSITIFQQSLFVFYLPTYFYLDTNKQANFVVKACLHAEKNVPNFYASASLFGNFFLEIYNWFKMPSMHTKTIILISVFASKLKYHVKL